ncbi:hypothetical protein PpBr36_05090 [Pyricularia pennisetigena]|uniref:hypothetical protein n=1 Tax=Pyricularia pennisetigena TaxID=1578925 RepID=UPI001153FBB6|nr:hypothetical protein PpBr36_05090 [Pyricularia pennisetigena]TLS27103.1 hypothetical protein PpBr36_05090 [Pyricularia pennisetigena]
MPLHLRPATSADVTEMVDVYFSAFASSPLTQIVFPELSPASRKLWTDMLAEELHDARAHTAVVVDSPADSSPENDAGASPDGRIIAFAKWVAPSPVPDATSVPAPPPRSIWPADGDPAFADEFFTGITAKHAEIMGGRPHWYLELIATRAEDQGRGAGGMLMRWGVGLVGAQAAFLEAMEGAKALYGRFGFVTVQRMDFVAPDGRVVGQDFMNLFLIIKLGVAPVNMETGSPSTRPKVVKPKPIKPKPKPTGSGPNKPKIALRDQDF